MTRASRPAAVGSEILVAADAVSLGYGRTIVVRDVSLHIRPGAAVGIAGESGSGKSTLAKALVGDLTPRTGRVTVNGRSWSDVHRRDPERRRVQMIFQDPYSALNPRMTAREAISETLTVVCGVPRAQAGQRAGELLTRAGLSGAAIDARPHRLSGGQRQRVVIARAIACEPDLLIADEPTSSLDVSIQAQILDLLVDLREERGLALVLVSHDLAVLRHMTDTCLIMRDGNVVERGPTERVLSQPRHEYTRTLVAAHQDEEPGSGTGLDASEEETSVGSHHGAEEDT